MHNAYVIQLTCLWTARSVEIARLIRDVLAKNVSRKYENGKSKTANLAKLRSEPTQFFT